MPHCSFYSLRNDAESVINFILHETDLRIFESYSVPGCELREFRSFSELAAAYEVGIGKCQTLLMLYSPLMNGMLKIRRFDLKPKICPERPWRMNAEGWGLISLYFGGLHNGVMFPSDTNHNSENRATAWESTYLDRFGPAAAWDWKEVTRLSRRLNYFIRNRLAISKVGPRAVLPAAYDAIKTGEMSLAPN